MALAVLMRKKMVIITAVQNATTSGIRAAVKFPLREGEKEVDRGKERRPHDLVGSLLSLIDVSQLIF